MSKIASASVKIMLSYNYNHFESSMTVESDNEDGLTPLDVDNARKECQRLCDKAVKQYIIAKQVEVKRANLNSEKSALEREVREIKLRDVNSWSVTDKAKVKALEDHNWELRYDYQDDFDMDY